MPSREDELEDFKRRIDLRDYAASLGFEEDRRASSVNSTGMKHPDGEKIIIGMGHDRHWQYFSVSDPQNKGSVIDLAMNRRNLNLGLARRELRPWLDGLAHAPPGKRPPPSRPRLKPMVTDLPAVRAAYAAARSVHELGGIHGYLNHTRCIPPFLLARDRFRGRVAVDARGNALFVHHGVDKQVCGFEVKNAGFTGFAPGGHKGLWITPGTEQDRRLVVCETAVDALSYAALFDNGCTRYASIAGQMSPLQPGLLHRAFRALPVGSEIVLAMDHDDAGHTLVDYLTPVYENVRDSLGRTDLTLRIDLPPTPRQDWNDVLRTRSAGRDHPPAAPAPS